MSFIQNTREVFKKVTNIIPLSLNSTPSSFNINGANITIQIFTGTAFINPLKAATADANSIRLGSGAAGSAVDMTCDTLSVVSDTTATGQIIVWEG